MNVKEKAKLIDRLMRLNVKNKEWYEEYSLYLESLKVSNGTIGQYLNRIINFLEFVNPRNIEEVDTIEIQEYIYQSNKTTTSNGAVYALMKFYEMVSQRIKLSFEVDDLKEFLHDSKTVASDKEKIAIPLKFEDIVYLRDFLKREKKFKTLFTFEMIYQHGFQLRELERCTLDTWSPTLKKFNFKEDEIINDEICNLINENNVLKNPIKYSGYQYQIGTMSRYIERINDKEKRKSINYSDLEETRNMNFLKCPGGCGKLLEIKPYNWAIVEYSTDRSQWMVCRECALRKHR